MANLKVSRTLDIGNASLFAQLMKLKPLTEADFDPSFTQFDLEPVAVTGVPNLWTRRTATGAERRNLVKKVGPITFFEIVDQLTLPPASVTQYLCFKVPYIGATLNAGRLQKYGSGNLPAFSPMFFSLNASLNCFSANTYANTWFYAGSDSSNHVIIMRNNDYATGAPANYTVGDYNLFCRGAYIS